MELKVFSVYDIKSKVFSTPFFMLTSGAAIRGFSDLANDNNTTVAKHPEDYQLYQIATFDDEKAIFTAKQPVDLIATAAEFKRPTLSNLVERVKELPEKVELKAEA